MKPEHKHRVTSDYITHLNDNEVFVFGSNIQGDHAGGAALTALKKFGAVMGQGVGLQDRKSVV